MPRLPNVGDDSGTWGTILNEYLGVSHTPEGKLMLERWANAAARPASPTTNQVGFNEETESIEQYDGAAWVTLAGGQQDNTLDPTKLNTQPEMFDRFDIKPNGYTLTTGTQPVTGNPYQIQVNTTIKTTPFIEDNGLIAANDTLYYLGGEHTETIKSMTFEIEYKRSLNPAAVAEPGVTIAFASSPLFIPDQSIPSGSRIQLPVGMLHLSFLSGGPSGFGIGEGGSNFTSFATKTAGPSWGPANTDGIPYNIKTLVTFRLEGDEVSVTALGYTNVFKDPRVATGGIGKWWWIETAGNSNSIKGYIKIHRMWINAPSLDLAPSTNQPFSEILARLSSGGTVTLPQKYRIMGDQTSFPTGDPDSSDVLAFAGPIFSNKVKAQPYQNFSSFNTPHHNHWLTAPVGSSAPATNQSLGNVSFFGLTTLGEREELVLRGYFANNSNTKRLVINSGAIGDIFNSGDLTTSNKEWEIRLSRTVQTGAFLSINITFTIEGQNPVLRYFSSNYNVAFNAQIRVTGTAANDIVLRSADGIKYTV